MSNGANRTRRSRSGLQFAAENLSGIIELFNKMGQAREEGIVGGGIGFCGKFPKMGTGKTKWKVYHWRNDRANRLSARKPL